VSWQPWARPPSPPSTRCASSPNGAHAAGSWLHVDAAYAGSSWICEEERWSQDGVELADSLVINPHKWLLVPTDCSLIWTARPDEWREAFTLTPEYLRTDDEAFSLADYGPALGRRFRSLKLWAVLRCYGAEGLRAIQREHIRLARLFAGWVEESEEWKLVAPQRFSLVVFRLQGSDEENEELLTRVNSSGEIFINHTRLDGTTSCASRSATRGRRRTTCGAHGRCSTGRQNDDRHDDERHPRLRGRRRLR
jgi:aromatic-L-amino-acid/L-tryptophan decarboxylase